MRFLMRFGGAIAMCAATLSAAVLFGGCNEPPMYQARAEKHLRSRGVEEPLIERLVNRRTLSDEEAQRLLAYRDAAVLHLLASNPSISRSVMETLAAHANDEVRNGLAGNPSTPADIAMKFRTKGAYTTMNSYIARNPNVPPEILVEVHRGGEGGRVGFALNPKCPVEVMHDIARVGSSTERAWPAANQSLPDELFAVFEADPDETVRRYLRSNPAYLRYAAEKKEQVGR